MEVKKRFPKTIKSEQFRFGIAKINNLFLSPVNNRLKFIVEIKYQFEFINNVRLTIRTRENCSRISIVINSVWKDVDENYEQFRSNDRDL